MEAVLHLRLLFSGLLATISVSAAVRPHPTIELHPITSKTIRALRDDNHPAWARLHYWASRRPTVGGDVDGLLACSLMWAVPNSPEHFDCAWGMVRAKLYV